MLKRRYICRLKHDAFTMCHAKKRAGRKCGHPMHPFRLLWCQQIVLIEETFAINSLLVAQRIYFNHCAGKPETLLIVLIKISVCNCMTCTAHMATTQAAATAFYPQHRPPLLRKAIRSDNPTSSQLPGKAHSCKARPWAAPTHSQAVSYTSHALI